jgi:hypothetical protein
MPKTAMALKLIDGFYLVNQALNPTLAREPSCLSDLSMTIQATLSYYLCWKIVILGGS